MKHPIDTFGASLIAQLVKNLPAMQETPVRFLGWEDSPGPTSVFLGFSGGSAGKESARNEGDLDEELMLLKCGVGEDS